MWHSCTPEHNLHHSNDQGPFGIISRDEIRIPLIQIQTKRKREKEKDTFSKRYNPPILRHLLQSSTRRSCLAATSRFAVCSLTGYSSAHRRLIDSPPIIQQPLCNAGLLIFHSNSSIGQSGIFCLVILLLHIT